MNENIDQAKINFKRGLKLIDKAEYIKAVQQFRKAYEYNKNDESYRIWIRKAEWLANYRTQTGTIYKLTTSVEYPGAGIGKTYSQRIQEIWMFHRDYGVFLAHIGEYADRGCWGHILICD